LKLHSSESNWLDGWKNRGLICERGGSFAPLVFVGSDFGDHPAYCTWSTLPEGKVVGVYFFSLNSK